MKPIQKLSLAGQIATQAQFIAENLQQTAYQHTTSIDVDRGVYDCDCGGYVSFVLERAAPTHYAMIPKEADQSRPRAFKFYEFFHSLTPESQGGWHQISLLRDARRGDIIAWRFPAIEKGHDTGHVLIVSDTPTADDSGVFSVRLYDSAAKPHFDDTRTAPGATGIGSGTIHFKVDEAGRPISFQFAPGDSFETFPIAIGRLEPLPA